MLPAAKSGCTANREAGTERNGGKKEVKENKSRNVDLVQEQWSNGG